jgi:hypothetical protein
MSFDWSAYLILAQALASAELPGGREASFRSAASRAYFAAFATARRQSRERHGGVIRKSAAEHGEVATFFAIRGETGGEIAVHLARLRFCGTVSTTTMTLIRQMKSRVRQSRARARC